MNEEEQAIADALYGAIQYQTNFSERSLQSKAFKVGVSDLGFCSERTRRMLDQQVPEEKDMLPAWIGTALGDYLERAAADLWPEVIRQATVTTSIPGEGVTYTIGGHPDLLLPEGIVLDAKTAFGLDNVERSGPSQQQQFQRHIYAKAAHEGGFFNDNVALEDVKVGNVWLDRGGVERRLHVQMEKYNPEFVTEAGAWLDEVVYAYTHGIEARKEPPRDMCAKACGFYAVCRALDTDVEGLLTDPEVVTAVDLYDEGTTLMRRGKRLQEQAKVSLKGITGSTGQFTVRWTTVNASDVAYTRNAYDKLEVRKVPAPKGVVRG